MSDANDPNFQMAAERTLLAWIRTGVAVMALGFVLVRHDGEKVESMLIGFVLILLGAAVVGFSAREYAPMFRGFHESAHPGGNLATLSVWFAVALAAAGVVLAVSLLVRSLSA